MSLLPAPLPALERSLKVTNISNDLLPMGCLTHFTPFHRNKGGLTAFHHFLSGGQGGTKAGAALARAGGHHYSPRGTRLQGSSPFPCSQREFTHCHAVSELWFTWKGCQSWENTGLVGLTWPLGDPLGKDEVQTIFPPGFPPSAELARSSPFSPL